MQILKVLIFMLLLVFFHELGHVASARLLGLNIQKIGFQLQPYPHFYVAVKWPKINYQKYIYLFSGTFFTIVLFSISLYNHFFGISALYWAFAVQFAIETNPFYSDFTIASISNNKLKKGVTSYAENYKVLFQEYQYTLSWYAHFIIWTFFIVLLISHKNKLL